METELRSAAGDTAQGTAPQTGQAPEALSTVPGQTSPRNDLAKKKKSAMKRRETIFLVCILALPVLNWLIFWLSVNVSSFVLAFQDNAGRSAVRSAAVHLLIDPEGERLTGIAYNATVLAALGFEEPNTTDELFAICESIATGTYVYFPQPASTESDVPASTAATATATGSIWRSATLRPMRPARAKCA